MHPVQIVFMLICLTLLAFGLLWLAGKAAERVQQRQVFRRARPVGYVERGAERPPVAASSPQTQQTPDQTDAALPKFGREQLLTLYTAMRAHGFSREAARAALRGVAPLDNNLWAEAAPKPVAPDEPQALTPYAGRPYDPTHYEHEVTV